MRRVAREHLLAHGGGVYSLTIMQVTDLDGSAGKAGGAVVRQSFCIGRLQMALQQNDLCPLLFI